MHFKTWGLLFALVVAGCSSGDGPETKGKVSQAVNGLGSSNFEILDGNLKQDSPSPSIDWASVNEVRKEDLPTGTHDDSFGQGTKEDTAVPSVTDGSIPNNKSDLLHFGVYQEKTGGKTYVHMFWQRVQDPTGTTNMDFEFNQSRTLSGNGVTPVRTSGDLLIMYDLSNGGTNPTMWMSRWRTSDASPGGPGCEAANSYPCWGPRVNLSSAQIAAGSINTAAIINPDGGDITDGLGDISARTFGEATVDFSAIAANTCLTLGSAYLKSRSSDTFTSALKDFIAPINTDISNCGGIKIIKKDDANNALAGATFTVYNDYAPTGGTPGVEDTSTGKTCTTDSTGVCTVTGLLQGSYWVVETTTPAGYDTAAPQTATVAPDSNVELTFVDPRQVGAIKVTKTRKHAADGSGDHPQAGVNFTVNGVTKTTDANGVACFDGLLFGSYSVHETTPTGYHGEADKNVTVDNKASCTETDAAPYAGETVSFHNTPLSNITVSFASQIAGGTAAKIQCTGLTADPADSTPNAFDDTSETFKDLEPGTYTCTVVVDP